MSVHADYPQLCCRTLRCELTVKAILAVVAALGLTYCLLRRSGFDFVRYIHYSKEARISPMPPEEAERVLRGLVGKRVLIVFTDGVAESVNVVWIDEDGFGYSGPEPSSYARKAELVSPNPPQYWTPFGAVASIDVRS